MNIIYSHNKNKALEKLEEIRKKKNNLVMIKNMSCEIIYEFEDDIWKFVRPNYNVRGNRTKKCLVDISSVTLQEYWEIILPSCIHGESDVSYF